MGEKNRCLLITPETHADAIIALSSRVRLDILSLVSRQSLNINEIAAQLQLPQSTVATNVAALEKSGLLNTEVSTGKKGNQKKCTASCEEIVIRLIPEEKRSDDTIEVEMPIGLFTQYQVTAPCGLCSPDGIIGFLDVPASFLDPDRMRAALVWFETGWVEYQFPDNSMYTDKKLKSLELSAELSSETPGTNASWKSDITVWINGVDIGMWTSPGDFGDKRGKFTPDWWKLEGSQYGLLKKWSVTEDGTYVDGIRVSDIVLSDLNLGEHHSIRIRMGVKEDARHPGGLNIFGKGFGNYDHAVLLRLHF